MKRIATLAACMAACTPDFDQYQINAIAERFSGGGQCEAEPADLAGIRTDVQTWADDVLKKPGVQQISIQWRKEANTQVMVENGWMSDSEWMQTYTITPEGTRLGMQVKWMDAPRPRTPTAKIFICD